MATLNEQLTELQTARDNMKVALEGKGQTVTKDIRTYAEAISNISSGGSETTGIKQFATEEEMQADPTAKEGDLAVVYGDSIANMTSTTETQVITFPSTVVLPEAFSSDTYGMFRAVDDSTWFDMQVMLSSSSCEIMAYGESGDWNITYTSTDGITYTRTDGGAETIDFGTTIKCYYEEEWDDAFGYFMQVGSYYFGGLYKYGTFTDKNSFKPVMFNDITINGLSVSWNGNYSDNMVQKNKLLSIANKIMTDMNSTWTRELCACIKDGKWNIFIPQERYVVGSYGMFMYHLSCLNNNGTLTPVGLGSNQAAFDADSVMSKPPRRFEVDLEQQTYVDKGIVDTTIYQTGTSYFSYVNFIPDSIVYTIQLGSQTIYHENYIIVYLDTTASYIAAPNYESDYTHFIYNLATTQFSANSDYVYEKEFYGKNGPSIGTLQKTDNLSKEELLTKSKIYDNLKILTTSITDFYDLFDGYTGETIPLIDTSNVISMKSAFSGCQNLKTVPLLDTSNVKDMLLMFHNCLNLVSVPKFNTSKVVTFGAMFSYCSNLVDVPVFDTSNATDLHMYKNGITQAPSCPKLSNESLNNTLLMCINAIKYTKTKTLKEIGLTESQATVCKTLSNYSAFTAAGWTTGY